MEANIIRRWFISCRICIILYIFTWRPDTCRLFVSQSVTQTKQNSRKRYSSAMARHATRQEEKLWMLRNDKRGATRSCRLLILSANYPNSAVSRRLACRCRNSAPSLTTRVPQPPILNSQDARKRLTPAPFHA